jgi:hypothetical protein
MEIKTLEGFDFVDCYFRSMAVHPLLSRLTLKLEAYFPQNQDETERKMGILSITLEGITDFQANVLPPLSYDLEANEIYGLTLSIVSGVYVFSLESDYLSLLVKCKQAHCEESQ